MSAVGSPSFLSCGSMVWVNWLSGPCWHTTSSVATNPDLAWSFSWKSWNHSTTLVLSLLLKKMPTLPFSSYIQKMVDGGVKLNYYKDDLVYMYSIRWGFYFLCTTSFSYMLNAKPIMVCTHTKIDLTETALFNHSTHLWHKTQPSPILVTVWAS